MIGFLQILISRYTVYTIAACKRDIKRIKDKEIKKTINQVFKIIAIDPFHTSLKTHAVNIPNLGKAWSSRVTGDLRLIWQFDENDKLIILTLRLQGHDTVYS